MLDKNALFALSLFPYLGFLWFLTRTKETPKMALFGFYALLIFVAVTIPAGLYAQVSRHAELANIDWLHGGAEAFLTLSNIFVVLGFRQAVIQRQRQAVACDEAPEPSPPAPLPGREGS
jgi:heme A synthase